MVKRSLCQPEKGKWAVVWAGVGFDWGRKTNTYTDLCLHNYFITEKKNFLEFSKIKTLNLLTFEMFT